MKNIKNPIIMFIGGIIMIFGVYISRAFAIAHALTIMGIVIFIYAFDKDRK